MGHPAPEGRNEGFPSGSVFDSSVPSRNAGEGFGDEFGSLRGEMEVDADRFAGKEVWTKAERSAGEIPFTSAQQQPPQGDGVE